MHRGTKWKNHSWKIWSILFIRFINLPLLLCRGYYVMGMTLKSSVVIQDMMVEWQLFLHFWARFKWKAPAGKGVDIFSSWHDSHYWICISFVQGSTRWNLLLLVDWLVDYMICLQLFALLNIRFLSLFLSLEFLNGTNFEPKKYDPVYILYFWKLLTGIQSLQVFFRKENSTETPSCFTAAEQMVPRILRSDCLPMLRFIFWNLAMSAKRWDEFLFDPSGVLFSQIIQFSFI